MSNESEIELVIGLLGSLAVAVLIFVNLLGFGLGILGGAVDAGACREYPTTRLAYIVPAFKVGCYLTESVK